MILTALLLVPLVGAALTALAGRYAKHVALVFSLLLIAAAGFATTQFSLDAQSFQLTEGVPLASVGGVDVSYHIGVDGVGLALILLTALLGLVAILISRREIREREPAHYAILLMLLAAIIGVFVSLNLVLFFVAWEMVLVLMFLLILWWGADNRKYAAMRFLIYTGVGSAGLLLAILILAATTGSVDLTTIAADGLSPSSQVAVFLLLLFAFAVKMPLIPFHGWLPDAHVQAPTAGSVLLAGVLLKLGSYGLLRSATLLPEAARLFAPLLVLLAFITIVYAALVCLAQQHLKRLIAYSSIVHMGLVLLGIATGTKLGFTGAVFEMVAHGLIAALLFALAGVVHERAGTFDLRRLQGLALAMPRTAWLLVLACLGGMGLPALAGFVAEFLIILAAFEAFGLVAIVALIGVLLTGAYFIRLITSLFGPQVARGSDASVGMLPFAILVGATLLLGLVPSLLTTLIAASVLP